MRLFASFFFFPNALFAESTLKNGRRRPVKCVGACVSSSSSRRGREGKGVVQHLIRARRKIPRKNSLGLQVIQ